MNVGHGARLAALLCCTATGCFRIVQRPVCEEVGVETIALDEVTPVGTPSDLLEEVRFPRSAEVKALPARFWDGSPAEAVVTVAPDEGSARWVELRPSVEESREPGLGTVSLDIEVFCNDYLAVPVVATVDTTDGVVSVTARGEARRLVQTARQPKPFPDGLTRFILDAPLDGAELPPTDEPLAAWDEVVAQVALAYDLLPPRGAGLSGSVGWSGTRENAATFELVLDFAEGGLLAP